MLIFDHLRRIRRLAAIMPLRSAITLAGTQRSSVVVGLRLKPISRKIYLRTKTSDLACIWQVFIDNQYSFPLGEPKVIVDAGANIGATSLYFHSKYPNAKIVAIEPDESNFQLLERNCQGLENISCVKAALWPYKTSLSFVDLLAEKWAFAVVPSKGQGDVDSITMEHLMWRFQFDRIDLLKLDIEGSERELFSHGSPDWLRKVSTICIEFHDRIKAGCARAFYASILGYDFEQEIRGENIVIRFSHSESERVINI